MIKPERKILNELVDERIVNPKKMIMKAKLTLMLFVSLLLGCNRIQDIDNYLTDLHADGKFNGTILVTHRNVLIYENAFGFADETKKVLLTPEYRFGLGSIYKEFPAVAVMQLKEKGLLSLDDKISAFLPHLPSWAKKVTVKDLFRYSSGLPKIDWNGYFQKGVKVKKDMIIADLANVEKLEFEPGTDYLYSNYNPFLLMSIVESLTGMSFKKYVEQNLLLPFELEGIVLKEVYPYKDASLMAIPFDKDFKVDNYEVEMTTICSSARGMHKWFSQLDEFKILTKESMKQLSEEIFPGENSQSPLGQCDWDQDDIKQHFHHGNSQNYECLVRNYKQEELLIILMTNQEHENLYDIADDIYDLYQRKIAKQSQAADNKI